MAKLRNAGKRPRGKILDAYIGFMAPVNRKTPRAQVIEIDSIEDLLAEHDDGMRELFAKALNLFVAPGMEGVPTKERLDLLRKAVDERPQ